MLVNHGDETIPGKPLDACFGKTVNDKVGKIIDDINNKSNKLTSLPNGTDIFQYADNAPVLTDIWCRVYASPQYPLGYNQDNDIWFHVLKLHNDKYWKVIAHDIRTDRIFAISKINGVMTKWTELLSTDKLANNGTTTASGFALDAKFGKNLQDQVNVLNSGLDNKVSTGSNALLGSLELSSGTPHVDFHFGKSTGDYTSRIIEYASGKLSVTGEFNVTGALMQGGADIIDAINNRIKMKQLVFNFSAGTATLNIDGASNYYAAMAQIVSNNEYVITQVKHDYGSNDVTVFARNCASGGAMTGNLTLSILLLK